MGVRFPVVSNEPEEEEGTAVDVMVDVARVVAGAAEPPSADELPADEEPSTSRLSLRAPMTSLPGRPARGSREEASSSADDARSSHGEASEDSSVSLVTPRFDSNALARQLAGAEPKTPEPDEDETGTRKREPVRDLDEATIERLAPPEPDDEQTLDPRAAVSAAAAAAAKAEADATGEEEITSRRLPLSTGANDRESEDQATPGFPAMRPRFDSEAAGQWPPWHAQPEEARAQLRGVVSPVSSGTEILPRNTVEEAFRMLASPQAPPPPPPPLAASPPLPQPPDVAARDPLAHRLDEPASRHGSLRSSGSSPSRPVKRGLSPFVVFLFAFLFTGGIFGGLVASRRMPLFEAEPAQANATPAAEATGQASAGTAPPAAPSTIASTAASAAPVASTSASVMASSSPAPSTPASVARPKTRGAPRRGKARP